MYTLWVVIGTLSILSENLDVKSQKSWYNRKNLEHDRGSVLTHIVVVNPLSIILLWDSFSPLVTIILFSFDLSLITKWNGRTIYTVDWSFVPPYGYFFYISVRMLHMTDTKNQSNEYTFDGRFWLDGCFNKGVPASVRMFPNVRTF